MSILSEPPLHQLQFYVTTHYPCSYLPTQSAQSLIAAPNHLVTANAYDTLIHHGFRRSGEFTYKPHCTHCQACIPVRIPVDQFKTNRSQRRSIKEHSALTTHILPVEYQEEHFNLYQDYQRSRHADSIEETSTTNAIMQYRQFIATSNIDTLLVEFRQNDQLKMVSVIDIINDGLSAVYTFFDTSNVKYSFGTYNILWQIAWAKQLGLPYVYLGYWIAQSQKMDYKKHFQPQEKLMNNEWRLESK